MLLFWLILIGLFVGFMAGPRIIGYFKAKNTFERFNWKVDGPESLYCWRTHYTINLYKITLTASVLDDKGRHYYLGYYVARSLYKRCRKFIDNNF